MNSVDPIDDERPGGWRLDHRHQSREGGFSAAGFAHHGKRAPVHDVEGHAADRA